MRRIGLVLAVITALVVPAARAQTTDPVGTYDFISVVNGQDEPALLIVTREADKLVAVVRPTQEDLKVETRNVTWEDGTLTFEMMLPRNPVSVRIVFDGNTGKGTWKYADSPASEVRARRHTTQN